MVESFESHQVDGLIVNAAGGESPGLVGLADAGTPVVLVDHLVRDRGFDIVTSDYRTPTLELMRHLREQGLGRATLFTRDCAGNSACLMLERIGDPGGERQERLVPTRLRIRASTRLSLDAEG